MPEFNLSTHQTYLLDHPPFLHYKIPHRVTTLGSSFLFCFVFRLSDFKDEDHRAKTIGLSQ